MKNPTEMSEEADFFATWERLQQLVLIE